MRVTTKPGPVHRLGNVTLSFIRRALSWSYGRSVVHMFDTGGIAGKVAQIHALLADVAVSITSEMTGPAAYEAMVEAIPAAGQLDLVLCLLAERMDRTVEFAADNATSMASWTRNQARSSHKWASERVGAGRALADQLPCTLAAGLHGELTLEHITVIRHAVDGLEPEFVASLDR